VDNHKAFINRRFSWQEGFGGFSDSKPQVDLIILAIKKFNIEEIIQRRIA